MNLLPGDLRLRGTLTRMIAELGYAPDNAALAAALDASVDEVEAGLQRLHDAHALVLHPHRCAPWAVHPFALAPGSCWVETASGSWWANCLYCGFGIAAALREDALIATRLGGERDPIEIEVRDGNASEPDLLFHLSTPAREWWDNIIYACSSFQPFRSERDVDDWCARHRLPKGAVMPLPQLWRFASDWYGDYVRSPWVKRSPAEVEALFRRNGLEGEFWRVGEAADRD